ncbi:ABC transporter substrate-binding protein [Marmoricola endophyticus]|uniref:ABC transporter substrate-binding protein n=1 Tax=Marmoricola endophyticus TaxID=2040280 RepID=A0A917F094_9ACTN|nr:transporter substrate-binding domain-containing protein [Marmoricola endophyticus]GGF39280.1 ABC transporter substrate-binding protein [Marmoricola endophyticus]
MTDPDLLAEIAPTGRLRVAINYGNIVLAQEQADGTPGGISAVLARELAERLGAEIDFATYSSAGQVTAALADAPWDLAFLAVDPKRAETIAFTAPYVEIEGTYLVPQASSCAACAEVDAPGVRVAVGQGTAYDLALSRTAEHVELVRYDTSPAAVDAYLAGETDVVAGVRQPLDRAAAAHAGHRVLADRFTAIGQAMAVPRGRDAALSYVSAFLAEVLGSGRVTQILADTGQDPALAAQG